MARPHVSECTNLFLVYIPKYCCKAARLYETVRDLVGIPKCYDLHHVRSPVLELEKGTWSATCEVLQDSKNLAPPAEVCIMAAADPLRRTHSISSPITHLGQGRSLRRRRTRPRKLSRPAVATAPVARRRVHAHRSARFASSTLHKTPTALVKSTQLSAPFFSLGIPACSWFIPPCAREISRRVRSMRTCGLHPVSVFRD